MVLDLIRAIQKSDVVKSATDPRIGRKAAHDHLNVPTAKKAVNTRKSFSGGIIDTVHLGKIKDEVSDGLRAE